MVDLNEINFVRIVDIPGNGAFLDSENRPIFDPWPTTPADRGGFDLEAVGIINGEPVPEPTSIIAILVSVILGFTRRRN